MSFCQQLRSFRRMKAKLTINLCILAFLINCRNSSVFPQSVGLKRNKGSDKIQHILNKTNLALLRNDIKIKRAEIGKLELCIYQLHISLSNNCLPEKWNLVYNTIHNQLLNLKTKHTIRLQNKLDWLKRKNNTKKVFGQKSSSKFPPIRLPNLDNQKIVNLSKIPLADDEVSVLELGLNFSLDIAKIDCLDIVTSVEKALKNSKLDPDKVDLIKLQLKSNLLEMNTNRRPNTTHLKYARTLKNLRNNENISISRSDKSNVIVVLDSDVYKTGVLSLLNSDTYKEVNNNPCEQIHRDLKSILKKCHTLTEVESKRLIPTYYVIPKFYALPKVHKPDFRSNLKFRPIIACYDSSTHPIAKFLAKKFKPLIFDHCYSVLNSVEFVNKINEMEFCDNDQLISLDIVSLFTSIPVNEAILALEKILIQNNIPASIGNDFLILTEFCVGNLYFSFRDRFFKQVTGLAMGSPLSPILCEIFMINFELDFFNTLYTDLRFWCRYVDDTFIVWNGDYNNFTNFLSNLNNFNKCIKFTVEFGSDNYKTLPFLDTVVVIKDNKVDISVYRKPFSVCLPPLSSSNHPLSQKISTFYTFVNRAMNVCNTMVNLNTELGYLKSLAIDRGFDPGIIDRAFKKFNNKKILKLSTSLRSLKNGNKNYVVLPYYPSVSSGIGNVLTKSNSLKVAFKPLNKLGSKLNNLKDKVNILDSCGVYKLSCNCDHHYIGQTRRRLELRLNEHIKSFTSNNHHRSAVATHLASNTGHEVDWKNVKLLCRSKNMTVLDMVESWNIKKISGDAINRDLGPGIEVVNFWASVLS